MTTEEIQQLVVSKANQYGINSNIALAQIGRESGFNPRAVGGSGERGLGQFMKGTWDRFGSGSFDNAFDPEMNLNAWGNYMTYLLGLFGGAYLETLIGYNGGEGHLINPQRYGPPSAAARTYAQAIMSQVGAPMDLGPIVVAPGGYEQIPDWLLWAGLGLLAIIAWSALSD